MRKATSVAATLCLMLLAGTPALFAQGGPPPLPPPLSAAAQAAAVSGANPVARGEFLVRLGACHDCHTPVKMGDNGPEPDMAMALAGHPQGAVVREGVKLPEGWLAATSMTFTAWSGPWGVSFTRNLTPDKETGIGAWTADEFVATIKSGRKQGRGRELLPPMPWQQYQVLSESDLKAIFAYLMTVPPIRNKVPDPLPPPPEPPAAAN